MQTGMSIEEGSCSSWGVWLQLNDVLSFFLIESTFVTSGKIPWVIKKWDLHLRERMCTRGCKFFHSYVGPH